MVNLSLRRRGPKYFIYRLAPVNPEMLSRNPTPQEAEAVHYHYQYLKNLSDKGTVLIAGRTDTADDQTFGIVVLEASDEEQARAIMTHDPAILRGIMTAELYPFRLATIRKVSPEK